jgi:transcriptional regulator with XRE-family HTH domain
MSADTLPAWAQRLAALRREKRWSLTDLAKELKKLRDDLPSVASLAHMISGDWESGKHKPGPRYRVLLATAFDVDEEWLFGEPVSDPPVDAVPLSETPVDLMALAWMVGRLDQRVDRRTLLQLAGSIAASSAAFGLADPLERLGKALTGRHNVDPATVTYLEARTNGLHWLEGHLSAQSLHRGLLAHLNEISSLLEAWPPEQLRHRLAITAGETAALAAWLAWDLGDHTQATALSRLAATAATQGDDPAVHACALGYQSYMQNGDAKSSGAMLAEALTLLPSGTSKELATRAWLLARQAEETGSIGDSVNARSLIAEAIDVYGAADPNERVWTRFLERTRFDSLALSVYTKIGDEARIEETASQIIQQVGRYAEHKKLAVVGGDIALAYIRMGDTATAVQHARASLTVTKELNAALGWGRLRNVVAALESSNSVAVRRFREEFRASHHQLAPSSQN